MIKRVNFTGRRRIARDRIDIEVFDGSPRTFDAAISLDGIDLLPQAAVVLEAMCAGSTIVERFDFGVVNAIRPPERRSLEEISGENVFFTLKVIDRSKRFGRILGIAEYVRPQRAGKQTAVGRRGILPIEPADLGQQLWRLDYKGPDVHLLVNKEVPELVDRARSDPLFYAAIYPEVVRQVLQRAITENDDPDEGDDRWPAMWLRFGRSLHPTNEQPPTPETSDEDQEGWIEDVVSSFCESHSLRDKYVAVALGNGGDA